MCRFFFLKHSSTASYVYFNTQTKRGSPYLIAILQLHRQQIAGSARVWLEICAGVATVSKPTRN